MSGTINPATLLIDRLKCKEKRLERSSGGTRKFSVLNCPTDCGNHGPLLAKCERDLGFDSWSVAIAQSYLGFQVDEVIGGRGLKALIRAEFKRWGVLKRAFGYDLIHFNFGSSLTPTPVSVGLGQHPLWMRYAFNLYSAMFDMFDVRLLKLAGKKIWVTFQGGDARQGDTLRKLYSWSDANEEPKNYYIRWMDALKRHRIRIWDKYADRIFYINPDLGHVLPPRAEFLPYICMDVKGKAMLNKDFEGRRVLGHITNHREPKGTRYVLDAVHAVRLKGRDFGFLFGERLPHETAMGLYEKIDVLLEQFVIGWYGAQAVECMAIGIPVVVFIRKEDMGYIPTEMLSFPFFRSDRWHLEEVIEEILGMDADSLRQVRDSQRVWVEKWHDPMTITRRLHGI